MTETLAKSRERWHLANVDDKAVKALAADLGIEHILAKTLLARSIGKGDLDSLREFLNPNPFLLSDYGDVSSPEELKKAVSRIRKAIKDNEMIIINGDPDADGISGTTILTAGLRHLDARVDFRFPVRSREGHGLQVRVIEEAIERDWGLIITTDCGSKDIAAAQYAKDNGVDVIITDHHILGKTHPNVHAFINPNLVEKKTLFKTLSGAGVSYKVILALFDAMGKQVPKQLNDFMLAVATLGTLSDRMSMLNPMNRVMVTKGCEALQHTKWEGLKAIKKVCRVNDKTLRPRHLSRSIIPRLNAPGRIGDPEKGIPDSSLAVEMLLTGKGEENAQKADILSKIFSDIVSMDKDAKAGKKDPNDDLERDALSSAASVDDVNEQRKFMTNKIEEEIDRIVRDNIDLSKERVIVVEGKNWNSGVIGIDTDRLKERFLRPAVILTKYSGNPSVRGSCRSIPNINMYAIIDKVGDAFYEKHGRQLFQMEVDSPNGKRLVNAFGGHAQACGFSLDENDVEEFKALLKEESKSIKEEQFDYHYDIIDKLPFSQVGSRLLNQLDKIGPFGQQYEFPIFYLQGCLLKDGKPFGNKYQEFNKNHCTFKVIEKPKKKRKLPPKEFQAVGFSLWEKFCEIRSNLDPNIKYDVIFTIEHDPRAKGKHADQKIRLNVLDIRESGDNVDSFKNPTIEDDPLDY